MRRTVDRVRLLHEQVGKAILSARTRENIGQGELASRVGLSSSHMYKIEQGITACPLHVLVSIADELDTTLDALVPVMVDDRSAAE